MHLKILEDNLTKTMIFHVHQPLKLSSIFLECINQTQASVHIPRANLKTDSQNERPKSA